MRVDQSDLSDPGPGTAGTALYTGLGHSAGAALSSEQKHLLF